LFLDHLLFPARSLFSDVSMPARFGHHATHVQVVVYLDATSSAFGGYRKHGRLVETHQESTFHSSVTVKMAFATCLSLLILPFLKFNNDHFLLDQRATAINTLSVQSFQEHGPHLTIQFITKNSVTSTVTTISTSAYLVSASQARQRPALLRSDSYPNQHPESLSHTYHLGPHSPMISKKLVKTTFPIQIL
jgi:hypothetical protein